MHVCLAKTAKKITKEVPEEKLREFLRRMGHNEAKILKRLEE